MEGGNSLYACKPLPYISRKYTNVYLDLYGVGKRDDDGPHVPAVEREVARVVRGEDLEHEDARHRTDHAQDRHRDGHLHTHIVPRGSESLALIAQRGD